MWQPWDTNRASAASRVALRDGFTMNAQLHTSPPPPVAVCSAQAEATGRGAVHAADASRSHASASGIAAAYSRASSWHPMGSGAPLLHSNVVPSNANVAPSNGCELPTTAEVLLGSTPFPHAPSIRNPMIRNGNLTEIHRGGVGMSAPATGKPRLHISRSKACAGQRVVLALVTLLVSYVPWISRALVDLVNW